MNIKYESLKRLWQSGRATINTIDNAVKKGWITQEQANEIITSTIKRN